MRWVGANRVLEGGYTNWGANAPSASNCFLFKSDGTWHTASCDDTYVYVCEGGRLLPDPFIILSLSLSGRVCVWNP